MRFQKHIFICTNNRPSPKESCGACGGEELQIELKKRLKERGLNAGVRANKAGCLDVCDQGAALVIYPQGIWYGKVRTTDLDEIIEQSIIKNEIIERLLIPAKTDTRA